MHFESKAPGLPLPNSVPEQFHTKSSRVRYRPDIDGLRAIAVLSVVGFHAFPGWVKAGFVGVDIFFVISGFLISNILIRSMNAGTFTYRDFYARRIKRIFPSLVLVLLTCQVGGWIWLYSDEHRQVGKHIAGGSAFISNLLLWQESGYFDAAADTKPLLHLWSLGIEEQFYIVWPILLALVWKRNWRFLWIVCSIALVSFGVNLFTVYSDPVAAFYSPLSRFWELMMGGALAYLLLQRPQVSLFVANGLAWAGLALFGLALLFVSKTSAFPGWVALLPTSAAVLLIFAGPSAVVNRLLLSNPVMVWVGLISFPLYLWHWPLLTLAHILDGGLPRWEVRMGAVFLSLVLAWLTFVCVEGPLRHAKSPWAVRSLVLAIGALLVGGLLIFTNQIVAGRPLTPLQAKILTPYDASADYRKGECFLDARKQTSADFAPGCSDAPVPSGKMLLLWGDSHAAHLYPGLNQIKGALGYQLVQRTATSCPPLVNGWTEKGSSCAQINEATMAFIATHKPDVVVIGSRWTRDGAGLNEKLEETVRLLKTLGAVKIVVFGPPPNWTPTLRHFLIRNAGVSSELFGRYSLPTADFNVLKSMDERLQSLSVPLGFDYVSTLKALCNLEGCQVRVGPDIPADLIAMDYDHFTKNASIYLMQLTSVQSALKTVLDR